MTDSEGPEQEALFYIEGPDERGLRLDSPSQLRRPRAHLGPCHKVAEVLSQWLGSIEYDEVETAR